MKQLFKILISVFFTFTFFTGLNAQAVRIDSIRMSERQEEATMKRNEQGESASSFGQGVSEQARNRNQQGTVKRVRGSRPDMTKARGARPPVVVRPSGSGMPRGVGKPGGAGRRVGR